MPYETSLRQAAGEPLEGGSGVHTPTDTGFVASPGRDSEPWWRTRTCVEVSPPATCVPSSRGIPSTLRAMYPRVSCLHHSSGRRGLVGVACIGQWNLDQR